jgi:fatty acid synthase subunit beta
LESEQLTQSIVEQICVQSVQWDLATNMAEITHAIDFGPGGYSGVGGLVAKNKEGSGVQVFLASTLRPSTNPDILDKSYIFDCKSSVTFAPNWAKQYRPRLIKIAGTQEVHIDTPFSRLIGTFIN